MPKRIRIKKQYVTVTSKCFWCEGKGKGGVREYQGRCNACKGTGQEQSKEQLFLCVGGPFDAQMKNASAGLYHQSYVRFVNHQGADVESPSAVYLHESLFAKLERTK